MRTLSPAIRRYHRTVLGLSMTYAVLLIGSVYAFKHHLIGSPLTYVAAILPALPIVGIFLAIGRYLVEEQDEYIRMMMARQALIASGIALSIATIWGFLENFDLVAHVDAYYIAVLWFAGLGIGALFNHLGNRTDPA